MGLAIPFVANTNESIVTRGHQYKLFKNRFYKDIGKFSFTNRIITNWNNLPEKVVMAKSINSFKNRLDKAWKHQDLLYNFEAKIDNRANISNIPSGTNNPQSYTNTNEASDPGEEADSEEEPTTTLRHSVASLNEGGVPSGRPGSPGS